MAASIAQPMRFLVDMGSGLTPLPQRSILRQGDAYANRVVVQLVNGKEPFDLTGITVKGAFMRPQDAARVELEGEAAGNEASVLLDDRCYELNGAYTLDVILVQGEARRTVLTIAGNVESRGSGEVVMSGTVQNIDLLLAQIDAMIEATADAKAAAEEAREAAGGGVSDEKIAEAVNAYLEENPPEGADGADGVSPTVSVEEIADGHRVTITDAEGTKSFDVMDGADGAAGANGANGADGKAATVTIGTVATLSAGSNAFVTNSGTDTDAILNFGIPKGADGAAGGGEGGTGADGEDGGYYVPTVNSAGDLSWTATKSDMPPVATVNIKGAQGEKGDKGDTGAQGEKGDKGDTGAQGEKGDKGDTGAQGIQGEKGDKGAAGANGVSVSSVKQTTTSSADGGTNVVTVTLSDGTTSTFNVKNGSKGSTGSAGADGKTPVKGTDYFTEADKQEIAQAAADLVEVPEDAVTSVNGKTGAVSLAASDIGAAPTNHASTATTYGVAAGNIYGHVRLYDNTDSSSGAAGGVAATPVAVKKAYDLAAAALPATGTAADSAKLGGVDAAEYAKLTDIPEGNGGDADTLGGKAPDYYLSPQNLADNSDFAHFVAQAGISGTHGTTAYAGDRWILDSGTVTGTADENGNGYNTITLNGTIRQKVPGAPAATPFVGMVSGIAEISYADGEITVTSDGGVIKYVGLYAGTWTHEPPYRSKGYAAEMAECQKYFIKYVANDGSVGLQVPATHYTNNNVAFTIWPPAIMRTSVTPTVSISVTSGWFRANGTHYSYTGLEITEIGVKANNYVIRADLTVASNIAQYVSGIASLSGLEFNADL